MALDTMLDNKDPKKSILIAGGDSFIYGLDMLDCNSSNNYGPSLSTWPALLSRSMGREYVCAAFPGSSNQAIARKTMIACDQHQGEDIFVAVGWSFLNRAEFRFTIHPFSKPYDPKVDPEGYALGPHGPWISFNHYDLYPDKLDKTRQKIHRHFDPDIHEFLENYYRFVGTDDVYEYYSTLKEIVLLQNYLKQHNIPYIFTSAHAFFHKTIDDPTIQCFLKQVDTDHWFFYPPLQGFLQWAIANDYPKRDEHPSEEAHAAAFGLIKDYLDTKN